MINKGKSYVYNGSINLLSSSGNLSQPYQYIGQHGYYKETVFNLYLLGQRWYDSDVGRFISRDPIGEKGGINLYIYVNNNPVNYEDSYGLKVEYCILPTQNGGFPWVQHVFIKVSGDKGCGFWPGGWPLGGRGVVEIPDPYNNNFSIPCAEIFPPSGVSPTDWDQCFADFCKNMAQNPPHYIYGFHDCIWFADKAVAECENKFKCDK